MSSINRARIQFSSSITLNESEIRALDALVGYGTDSFIEAFYKVMGKHYLQPHEQGLRSLFSTIRSQVLPALNDVEQARRDLNNAARKRIENEELRVAEARAAAQLKKEVLAIKVLDPSANK